MAAVSVYSKTDAVNHFKGTFFLITLIITNYVFTCEKLKYTVDKHGLIMSILEDVNYIMIMGNVPSELNKINTWLSRNKIMSPVENSIKSNIN